MRLLVLALFVAATNAMELAPFLKAKESVPNRYLVKLKDGADMNTFLKAIPDSVTVKREYLYVFNGVSIEARRVQVERIRKLHVVEYIEEDSVVRGHCDWGIDRINQRTLPLDARCSFYATGVGCYVYILDTGIRYSHEVFGGRAQFFWDFSGGDGSDCQGHGTHLAGIVASIATQATIYSVRVLNCAGAGLTSNIIAGLNAVASSGPRPGVCAVCLGGGASSALDNAVRDVIAAGFPTVTSAGNSNTNACNVSPARVAEAETVSSTTSTDARSSFSNYGSCIDLFAPGSAVTSASHISDTEYAIRSGTTMACAHVAGVTALHLCSGQCGSGASCKSKLNSDATAGVISNVGFGTPNLLLYSS